MAKEFMSGVYRPEDDARLNSPTSLSQVIAQVKEFERKKKRRKRRVQGTWHYSQPYESEGNLAVARNTYRMIGQRHPIDDIPVPAPRTTAVSEKLVTRIVERVDALRRSGVGLGNRIEYVLTTIDPPLTPVEWQEYRRRVFARYGRRRSEQAYRKREQLAAWEAWFKQAV